MIAALYVQRGGVYYGLPDVDPWDEARDARLYAGPWPVVAHPPCARWCRLARLVEARTGHRVGDDGGTFVAALTAVRRWGGVLEHPAWSIAWGAYGLMAPASRGWTREAWGSGWVTEISQAAYGHRSGKRTWLYYVGDMAPPLLDWHHPRGSAWMTWLKRGGDGRERAAAATVKRMGKRERNATPPAFRDVLLSIARSVSRLATESVPPR